MKISIITPSYNNSENISDSLISVLNQKGDFDIEHIVIDGKSTDQTIDVIKKFEVDVKSGKLKPQCKKYSFKWVSEKDNGMYDAIIKGFEMSNGEIVAWINTDDCYQDGAFATVMKIFEKNEVLWIKGITDYINKDGTKKLGKLNEYNQKLIAKGIYGPVGKYIQQDSTFWRRGLLNQISYKEITKNGMAGDFRLWQLFAEKTPLYSFNQHVSYFRKREGQKSSNVKVYRDGMLLTVKYSKLEEVIYKVIFKIEKILNITIIHGNIVSIKN